MSDSLKGQFLVATKGLGDQTFYKTVVLIVEHGSNGAMGLVVNRPSSVMVAHALSEHFQLPDIDDLVFVGGPVEPGALFVLHNWREFDDDDSTVVPEIYVGSNPDIFEQIIHLAADGQAGLQFRIFSGCAGWAPDQLEGELGRGDWFQIPATSALILNDDPYEIWDLALRKVYEANRILPHTTPDPELN